MQSRVAQETVRFAAAGVSIQSILEIDMSMNARPLLISGLFLGLALSGVSGGPPLREDIHWKIYLGDEHRNDQAVAAVLGDLADIGLSSEVAAAGEPLAGNSIVVGDETRNRLLADRAGVLGQRAKTPADPEGFAIRTIQRDEDRIVLVAGGSILGDVYGLYWLRDRLRVSGRIPEIDIEKTPDLKVRFTHASDRDSLRNALRYGANWVWGGPSVNALVPWNAEPEATVNEQNRAELRELIEYAHGLHLKFFVYEDEFSFHPSLLEEFQASLNPEDPNMWKALEAKYRRLLQAMPGIDGVRIRTGEATRVSGSYRAYDVMHGSPESVWSLAKRYRTFLQTIHRVVVDESDRIYYQRTWVTNDYEQHSIPAVLSDILTGEVPVRNLYLSPYLSRTDRFFHQPYNATFNLTPHNMIVLLAPLDYHARDGVRVLPTFPGPYFQEGLKTILLSETSNLRGVDFGVPEEPGWTTRDLTAYTVYRLSWDHREDVRSIARDFASIHFNGAASERLAEILTLTARAYKYGLYIEPVAYGEFSSLPHLRLTTFPARGFPRLDHGKEHVEFLRKIYFRCKPWMEETLLYLDHGLALARRTREMFDETASSLDRDSSERLRETVDLTFLLIQTNNRYVRTFFRYFDYREDPSETNRRRLEADAAALRASVEEFLHAPGCVYRLDGMAQLLRNVDQVLEDREGAESILAGAPGPDRIRAILQGLQEKYADLLESHGGSARKLLSWEGRVDGKDLIHIQGTGLEVEHLRYDPIADMAYTFFDVVPREEVTVIPRDIESRSFHPFILEQPTAENDFRATVYLSDYPEAGYSWWRFELYLIPKTPKELGLTVPWQE